MSGGSYKPRKVLTLQCWGCQNKFQATRPDARYCSAMCRKQASRCSAAMRSMRKMLVSTNAPQAATKLGGAKGKGK